MTDPSQCWLSIPVLIYQAAVPQFPKTRTFANPYAFAALDILFTVSMQRHMQPFAYRLTASWTDPVARCILGGLGLDEQRHQRRSREEEIA
jgi:hypothetical protein